MGGKGSGRHVKGWKPPVPPAPQVPPPNLPPEPHVANPLPSHPHATCCWCGRHFRQIPSGQWECPTEVCCKQQYAWGISIKVGDTSRQVFLPTPRQVDFFRAQRQFVRTLYGGAAGGAKSHVLRWGLYRVCLSVKRLSAILIRANYKDLEETHLLHLERDAPLFGAKYNRGERRMYFPQTGSTIVGGHMDDKTAKEGYLSREYDVIVPDELVTYDETDMIELFSRARTSNPDVMAKLGGPKVWSASNPGPRGALWVRDFFITKQPDPARYPKYNASWYTFVQAKVDDNPYLDGFYRESLDQMPEPRRSQLLEGDWNAFEGAFFNFRSFFNGKPWHVREQCVPPGTEWIAGLDWGFNAPWYCIFIACLPDGHLYAAKELKGQQMPAEDVAKVVKNTVRTLIGKDRLRSIYYDPSMANKTGADRGSAIVEWFQKQQLPMRKGDNQRGKLGWQRVHDQLREAPDGTPWLSISPQCTYLIRTLPIQEQSEHDADDIDSAGDDHACDALRYALSRPSPTRPRAADGPKRGSVAYDIAQLREASMR